MPTLTVGQLADRLTGGRAGEELSPLAGCYVVAAELDGSSTEDLDHVESIRSAPCVTVGVVRSALPAVPGEDLPFDVLLCACAPGPSWVRPAAGVDEALGKIEAVASAQPGAATALVQLLRLSSQLEVAQGVLIESLCYSMLLGSQGFQQWLRATPRPRARGGSPAVVTERRGDELLITLDRPHVRNAYNVEMRDELAESLELAVADETIERVQLSGNGAAFCSGGDLSEFGTAHDPAFAHLVRSTRNPALLAWRCSDRLECFLHGPCVGAGVELPAFASRVVARRDTTLRLPEVAMGLVPGAGGTVSLPRRIGRQRTAYWALTGSSIDADTAASWGLIDAVID